MRTLRAPVHVTVVYCPPGQVWSREVELAEGATLEEAIRRSGVLEAFTELAAGRFDIGVFNRSRPIEEPACDGDRIEIYRPLTVDPKEARRIRAEVRRRRSAGR